MKIASRLTGVVLGLLPLVASTQDKRWTTYANQASKYIVAIGDELKGSIWFSNEENGVTKYDGHTWDIFDEKNTAGVIDKFCYALAIDGKGNLWCGTGRKGIAVYDGQLWKKYTIYDGLAGWHVYSIAINPNDGKIWIGTEAGISVWDGKAFRNFTREKDGLSSNQIAGIVFDKHSGNIWAGGYENGICKYDGIKWKTFNTTESPLASDQVNALFIDSAEHLWVASHGGITRIALREQTEQWKKLKIPIEVTDHYYTCITEDTVGNIWFGTRRNGVWVFETKTNEWSSYTKQSSDLPDDYVTCLLARPDGTIWAGTYGGGAASIQPYKHTPKLNDPRWTRPPPLK